MSVTSSNIHTPTKSSKFVGICIQRSGSGLRSAFVLRNIIDNLGELYYHCFMHVFLFKVNWVECNRFMLNI